MPIEIRELIIKTTVSNQNKASTNNSSSSGQLSQGQLNSIAEKIFEIIKQKSER